MIHKPPRNLSATSAADSIRINRFKLYKNNISSPLPNFSKSASQLSEPPALAFPTVSFLTDKFPFFPKFLLMFALTLLVFAGQVSAQGLSVSLEHITDGTAGIVSGQGTTFTVRVSQTGVDALLSTPPFANASSLEIDVAFDPAIVSLATPFGLFKANTESGATLTVPAPGGGSLMVPPSLNLTFTTADDYDGAEFPIGVTRAALAGLVDGVPQELISIPLSVMVTFNSVRPPPLEPLLVADATEVVVPVGSTATATVTAMNFAEGATINFQVQGEMLEQVTSSQDGATLTLVASGSATVTVMATDGMTTTNPVTIVFVNSVRPPPLNPQLHLDTQIESPAQNNSVLIFTDKRPGDTLQIQLFVPDAAGHHIQAFTLELSLQGKTFANFISSISGSDWMGEALFSGLSSSDNPTLSGLFLNAATVPMTGYLGQIELKVSGVLSDEDKLRVTSAFLAVAGGTLQSVDVSDAELSFAPICPGDFDDNGMVNMADFVLFGEVFGTRSSDARYNVLMDMDSSGGIDVADFLLFVDVFDTTCEQQPPGGGGGGGGQTGVSIPDANLRAVIEDKLGKASGAPITQAEMASLTHLDAPNSEISDLTGLEFATSLTDLNLGGNSITDIPQLKALTNLSVLSLRDNKISDISVLSDLTNLERLTLATNNLSDISSLQALTKLRILLLRDNKISDLAPLVANTGLGSGDLVDVRDNPLSTTSLNTHIPALQDRGVNVQFDATESVTIPDANLRAVIEDSLGKASGAPITQAEMANLTRLEAQNKGIRDLTGLEFAINLTWLDLSEARISSSSVANTNSFSDLSPLANLTRLTWLDLSYNDNISDISSLSGLTNLTHLNLSTNWAIADFSSLSGLTNLTELYLFGISDVSVLSGLTNLTTLSINSTDISDISSLSGLTNLTELRLDGPSTIGTDISDISPLSGLTNLTKLSLSGHKISDISSLPSLTNLTELYFSFVPISDISSLSGLTSLTRLGFHVSNIADISPLSGLTNLTWLNFTFGDFSDILPLSGLTNLTYVRLIHCRISDLAPLVANTGLGDGDEVNVENNPLSTTSRNTHIPALQARGVKVRF